MANNIEQALAQTQGLADPNPYGIGIGKLHYQAATIEKETTQPSALHQIFDSIIGMGGSLVKAYDTHLKVDSEDRFNKAQQEFAKTGNSKVFDEAINQGTLFHHDNPYTHKYVYNNMGARALLAADTETQDNLAKGAYLTQEEFEKAKQENRQRHIAEIGKNFNIDTSHQDFADGFARNVDQSDNVLNDNFQKYHSSEMHKQGIYTLYDNISATANDLRLTPLLRTRALQAQIVKAQHDRVVVGQDEINKLIDFSHQQVAGSPDGHAWIEQYSDSNIQTGFDDQGNPVMATIRDRVGGREVVRERRLQGESRAISDSQSFQNDMSNQVKDQINNPDKSLGMQGLEQIRIDMKKRMGISPEQHDDFIDGSIDRARAQIEEDQKRLNNQREEGNKKAILQNSADGAAFAQMTDAMGKGQIYDFKNAQLGDPSFTSENTKQALLTASKRILNDYVLDPKLDSTERNRRFGQYINMAVHDPESYPMQQLQNLVTDADREMKSGVTVEDSKSLKTLMGLWKDNPNTLNGFLQDDKLSGPSGKSFLSYAEAINNGGLSTDQLEKVNQFKRQNPDQYKQVIQPKVLDDLYGAEQYGKRVGGALKDKGVPMSMSQSYQQIYENSLILSDGDQSIATRDADNWMKLNTITYQDGSFLGHATHGSVILPLATVRVDSPDNDPLVMQDIGQRISDAQMDSVAIHTDDNGNIEVYDVTGDGNKHFTITHQDLVNSVHKKIKETQSQTEEEKSKATQELESRSDTSNPTGAYRR